MIDLRSDTVTKPSPAMRMAMAQAEVGDDVYGEDPTINGFEARVAKLLGHEAGLFCSSGSQANQLGLRLHVRAGTDLLTEWTAHIVRAEVGAAARLSGVTTRTWRGERGLVDLAQIDELIAPRFSPYLLATAAIAVENTHNFGGGTIQPLPVLQQLRRLADERGLTLHLDGARLWNAHIETGVPLEIYGRLFDTVSVCFSKGLGAPVGSMLVGSREAIAQARIDRKMLGGGMRQAGILAAAAEYALDHHLPDLAIDHRHAQILAAAIADADPRVTVPEHSETNIVVLDLAHSALDTNSLVAAAAEKSVLVSALGPRLARLVTHRDVTAEQVDQAADVLSGLLRAPAGG